MDSHQIHVAWELKVYFSEYLEGCASTVCLTSRDALILPEGLHDTQFLEGAVNKASILFYANLLKMGTGGLHPNLLYLLKQCAEIAHGVLPTRLFHGFRYRGGGGGRP